MRFKQLLGVAQQDETLVCATLYAHLPGAPRRCGWRQIAAPPRRTRPHAGRRRRRPPRCPAHPAATPSLAPLMSLRNAPLLLTADIRWQSSAGPSNCSLHMKAYVTLLQCAYNKVVCLGFDTVGADVRLTGCQGAAAVRAAKPAWPGDRQGADRAESQAHASGITETTCREAQAAGGPPRPAGSGEGVSGTVIWLSRSGSRWLRPAACKL